MLKIEQIRTPKSKQYLCNLSATCSGSPLFSIWDTMDFSSKHQYTIGGVARRTQTHPETLRVWERRYQLIVPGRSDTGRRYYSEGDIAKLLLVKQLTEQGHSVSSLADLSIDELRARVNASSPQGTSSEPRQQARCRVIFLKEALRLRIGRELLMFGDIDVLERPRASQSLAAAPNADILIVELATINERSRRHHLHQGFGNGCGSASRLPLRPSALPRASATEN